jgi:hypothetical protein
MLIAAAGGCALFGAGPRSEIELGQNSVIRSAHDERGRDAKKGDVIVLESEPLYFESPGLVSAIVIPETVSGRIKLNLRASDQWSSEAFDRRLNGTLSDLVAGVGQVFKLLASQKAKEALEKTETMEIRYPKVAYLKVLKASCLTVLGERGKAKALLENVLAAYPEQKEAKELLEVLDHGARKGRLPASSAEADAMPSGGHDE